MPLFEVIPQIPVLLPDGRIAQADPRTSLRVGGPILPVHVSVPPQIIEQLKKNEKIIPPPIEGIALFDTGATCSVVDRKACESLGLPKTGLANMGHAGPGGPEMCPCYPIELNFVQGTIPQTGFYKMPSCDLNFNPQKSPILVLIGRDIMARIKFTYNGPQGRFEVSF